MRGSRNPATTAAVSSVQPSPTTRSSKSPRVCPSTDRIAYARTLLRLCVATMTLNVGAAASSTRDEDAEAAADWAFIDAILPAPPAPAGRGSTIATSPLAPPVCAPIVEKRPAPGERRFLPPLQPHRFVHCGDFPPDRGCRPPRVGAACAGFAPRRSRWRCSSSARPSRRRPARPRGRGRRRTGHPGRRRFDLGRLRAPRGHRLDRPPRAAARRDAAIRIASSTPASAATPPPAAAAGCRRCWRGTSRRSSSSNSAATTRCAAATSPRRARTSTRWSSPRRRRAPGC